MCMQVQRINITLPQQLLKKLRFSIPEGQRSRFISHAIEDKLEKEKTKKVTLEESLKANYEYDKKVTEDWKSTELDAWSD